MLAKLQEQLALANSQEDPAQGKALALPVLEWAERTGDRSLEARRTRMPRAIRRRLVPSSLGAGTECARRADFPGARRR